MMDRPNEHRKKDEVGNCLSQLHLSENVSEMKIGKKTEKRCTVRDKKEMVRNTKMGNPQARPHKLPACPHCHSKMMSNEG